MKKIGDSIDIPVGRVEANFDRACDSAYWHAVRHFGIDEDGHSKWIRDWHWSTCWIEILFMSYKRIGNDHNYMFLATAKKSEE